MSQHIAFLGLGAMGAPIARHLAAKGPETVTACDADPARLAGLDGPRLVATTDRSRIAGADVLFLCLPDGAVVEAALFGPDGIAERLAPGAIVVDLSTTTHADALRIGRALEACGRRFLDAPVSGAPAGAEAGTLTVMCGGAPEAFEAVRPLLDRFGATVLHMGRRGRGSSPRRSTTCSTTSTSRRWPRCCRWRWRWGSIRPSWAKSSRRARAELRLAILRAAHPQG